VLILGIDPGKSGGLATIGEATGHVLAWKMPPTERDLWSMFTNGAELRHGGFAYIEKVHAMPGQGVTSMFSFGQNYGMLRAFLIAAGIPFEEVTPQAWQKALSLPTVKQCGYAPSVEEKALAKLKTPEGKEMKKALARRKGAAQREKKRRHKPKCQELFPGLKITDYTADALLIAEYGRRLRSR